MAPGEFHWQPRRQVNPWPACIGDFSVLKEFLGEKDRPLWVIVQLLDALLRGFGQVVFANNPISGFLIACAVVTASPGAFICGSITAFLGLLLSMLMRDSHENVENGLTVYNPLLVGIVSYAVIPQIYGAFDSFSILLVLLGTILSVYLARSLGSDKFPCTTWPFNLVEFTLLLALRTHSNFADATEALPTLLTTENATSISTVENVTLLIENATSSGIDWGLVVRGVVVSASQVYAIDNVASGSIIYLATLIYSPATAGFSFLGALIGTFVGIQLGVPYVEIYSGFWGYNCVLIGAALGGNLFVLNKQTSLATIAAIVYTALVQYSVLYLFRNTDLPILTVPFILVVSLFVVLRKPGHDAVFPQPSSATFPEKQRHEYLARKHEGKACEVGCSMDLEAAKPDESYDDTL